MADVGRCRSCGARVMWAETTSGKKMPLDFDPVPHGKFVLLDGKAIVAEQGDRGHRYNTHFATCPNAKKHRKT